MKWLKNYSWISIVVMLMVISCSQKLAPINDTTTRALAFPGAEGYGKYTTGGRGGAVVTVTNLNDNGAGSLREALNSKEPRMIVFALSGTIHLDSRLNIPADKTIAGQTAPGDGICLADYPVVLSGDNIIVRYLRFRMGDKAQKGGMVDGNGGDDAFGGTRRNHIIIDHCSVGWSTDEAFSIYAGDSTTLQWNLIAEPLNYSYHYEAGDTGYEHHGYGAIWGGRHTSAHHNLFAHCNSRTPRLDGERNISSELLDYRNNVIYNWGSNNVYAGEGGQYNIVNNYYKYGPSTNSRVKYQLANPYKKLPALSYGKYYITGNYVDGAPAVTANNWLGVLMHEGTATDTALAKAIVPFEALSVTTQSAPDAYEKVVQEAGASLHRDTLDQRIIRDVKNRTGRLIDVQGGYPHGTPYEQTLSAWPALRSTPAPTDTDRDGMPDVWEIKNGLNAHSNDAAGHALNRQYTNIEVYINSLVPGSNKSN